MDAASRDRANAPIADDTLQPGSQVGPYVIVRRLGAGGMGQVFLGNDDRLERKVALKRLLPSNLDPDTSGIIATPKSLRYQR